MADKNIGSLPRAESLDDSSLLVVEQQGQAMSASGSLFKNSAVGAVKAYVDLANDAADEAKRQATNSSDFAQSAKNAKAGAESAKSEAETAKNGAEAARSAIENLNVTAEAGETGGPAVAQKIVNADGSITIKLTIPRGIRGGTGLTPEITIGEVTKLAPDATPTVTFTGPPEHPVMSLGLPQGFTGLTPSISVKDVTKLSPSDEPFVNVGGTAEKPELSFGLPQGKTGLTPVFSVKEVYKLSPDSQPEITIGGTAENPEISFGLPQGKTGLTPAIEIGGVEKLSPDSIPTVEIKGTPEKPVLWFGIPQGMTGLTPEITAGTAEKLAPTAQPTITVTGTPEHPVINIGVPQGEQGGKGDPGKNFTILGYYPTLEDLKAAHPNPEPGESYGVGTSDPYDIYIFDGVTNAWKNNGKMQGAEGFSPTVSTSAVPDGTKIIITDKNGPHEFVVKNGESGITIVDAELSDTSVNPVQNKVVKKALDGKQKKGNYLTEHQSLIAYAKKADIPNVPSWAMSDKKPEYTAQEVGALSDTTTIPTKLSQLTGDTTHRTVTDTDKQKWNGKSDFSGNYSDLKGKPTGTAGQFAVFDSSNNIVGKTLLNLDIEGR